MCTHLVKSWLKLKRKDFKLSNKKGTFDNRVINKYPNDYKKKSI